MFNCWDFCTNCAPGSEELMFTTRSAPPQTSGIDDGVRVFAVGISWADPDAGRRRPLCRLVATSFDSGGGAAGVGVGRRGRGRAWPGTPNPAPAPWHAGVSWLAGGQGADLQTGDPEVKGLVERFHDYLERAFLPGRVFTSPADFNTQLADWLVRAIVQCTGHEVPPAVANPQLKPPRG